MIDAACDPTWPGVVLVIALCLCSMGMVLGLLWLSIIDSRGGGDHDRAPAGGADAKKKWEVGG